MKTISFTTSQFVTIDYELASTMVRIVASLLDFVFLVVYMAIAGYMISANAFSMSADHLTTLSVFLIRLPWLLYSPLIEYFTNGQSLGKMIMGIRVVKSTGETAGLREYFTRWIFRIVDIWAGGFGFLGALVSGTNEKRQRIGDIMADTVVIKVRNYQLYSLEEVLAIKQKDNHEVTYPQAIRFTDEDMLLIKNAIMRYKQYPNEENKQFLINLSHKASELIGLTEEPSRKLEFLQVLLQDYVVLTR